jgi:hypothetical protein
MYTPKFSDKASITIRRLAWALGLPMTKTVDIIINEISTVFLSSVVCPKCQDKSKCNFCGFNQQSQTAAEKPQTATTPAAKPAKAA